MEIRLFDWDDGRCWIFGGGHERCGTTETADTYPWINWAANFIFVTVGLFGKHEIVDYMGLIFECQSGALSLETVPRF